MRVLYSFKCYLILVKVYFSQESKGMMWWGRLTTLEYKKIDEYLCVQFWITGRDAAKVEGALLKRPNV